MINLFELYLKVIELKTIKLKIIESYENLCRKHDVQNADFLSLLFILKKFLSLTKKREKPIGRLKETSEHNTHVERENLKKQSDDLFILNFFGFGENI